MKKFSITICYLMIFFSSNISFASGDQVAYRWRNDNGDVYSATWKDSVNTPVALTDYENIRLRIEDLVMSADTSNISLRYTEDLYNANWISITNDTGKFIISPSQYLIDTMSYYNNQLLPPLYQNYQYRRTITIDSSISYLLISEELSIYEFEYSIKPTSKIQPGSAYFISCLMGGWEANEYAVLMTPPVSWQVKYKYIEPFRGNISLNDVFFTDGNNGFAVGGGMLISTTDAGENWFEISISVSDLGSLNAIYFANADVGWIVGTRAYLGGDEGIIINTTNGGESWELQKSIGDISWLNDVSFSDENNGTVVGSIFYGGTVSGGIILRTTDGGENWTRQTSPYPYYEGILSSVFFNQNIGMAVGWYGKIIKTTNGGQNWFIKDVSGTFHLNDVFLVDENIGVAVGWDENTNGGLILRTTNGGNTWTNMIDGGVPWLSNVYFANNNIGWVAGNYGWILKTTDGGISWNKLTTGAYNDLGGIYFVDNETGWAVGSNKILKTTNGGITTFIDEEESEYIPDNFSLAQNYPNPFNPSTVISYQLPVSGNVTLKVYDVLGNEIETLVDEYKPAGTYEIEFSTTSHPGNVRNLASGIYFYQLRVGKFIESKKMILIK